MTLTEYEYVEPDAEVLTQLRALARLHPVLLEDLLRGLEEFIECNVDHNCLVAEAGPLAIYLAPPRFVLRHFPAPAALVWVEHDAGKFQIAECIPDYGGIGEPEQWDRARERAEAMLQN